MSHCSMLLVANFGHVPLETRAVYALDNTVSRLPPWRLYRFAKPSPLKPYFFLSPSPGWCVRT
jgi:hypothetical protein